jgi:hypothetical protein
MNALMFALGAVLIVLFVVLFYRAAHENYGHHEIFLDDATQHLPLEQAVLMVRVEKLDWLIKALYLTAGGLFVAVVVMGFRELLDFLRLIATTTSQ